MLQDSMTQDIQPSDIVWKVPSEPFTEITVGNVGEITWGDQPFPDRIGSARVEIVTILREDIQEWMLSNHIRYMIDIEESNLVFFDLDSFLLFKLTWVGS